MAGREAVALGRCECLDTGTRCESEAVRTVLVPLAAGRPDLGFTESGGIRVVVAHCEYCAGQVEKAEACSGEHRA